MVRRNQVGRAVWLVGAAVVLVVGVMAFSGCAAPAQKPASSGSSGSATTAAPSASSALATLAATPTRDEVRAFVESAVQYARANGKEAALTTFTAPGGEFHDGELYIYAYDFNGNVIAHGGDKNLVGKNLMDMKDPNGVPVIQELTKRAQSGSGWLFYTWPNPANGNQQEPKLGYVVKVDDTWFLGSGAYGPAAVNK